MYCRFRITLYICSVIINKQIENMSELKKYQEQVDNLALYIKEHNLDISSPEKLQIAMTSWLRSNIKFYNQFDELPMEHKKKSFKHKII